MVSTRKKKQQNRKFLSQLDNFDRNSSGGSLTSSERQIVEVLSGVIDPEFTADNINRLLSTKENAIDFQILERSPFCRMVREISSALDSMIHNAILTDVDNFITPGFELAVGSMNASSGQDITSVIANSDGEARVGITASSENVSDSNNIFHEFNISDDYRCCFFYQDRNVVFQFSA